MFDGFRGKRVLVTGGFGFIGKHLTRRLEAAGAEVILVRHSTNRSEGADLTSSEQTRTVFENVTRTRPLDYVFHLAGWNGGVRFNETNPFEIFHRNTLMGLNVLHECTICVSKVLTAVTSCAYNGEADFLYETEFLSGKPHATVACHGYAKRNLQLATQFFNQQYGLDAICVCPNHVYGEGDSFNPERTKVMGSLIRRFVDAAEKQSPFVTLWGTGSPMREFIYVDDCARMILQAMERYNDATTPLNLGTGQEVTIRELAELVAVKAGFVGEITWDGRIDGQTRKRLDLTKMYRVLGPQDFTTLETGVERTINWYRSNRTAA